MSTFQERLKQERTKKRLSQREFAKQFNIAPSTIASYETGARKPDLDTLKRLANFFGVTTDYLLGEKQIENSPNSILLGKRLRDLRLLKSVDQETVANILNISRSTYTKYETGHSKPNYESLVILANYFNVTVDYLLGNKKVQNDSTVEHNSCFSKDKLPKVLQDLDVRYLKLAKKMQLEDISPETIEKMIEAIKTVKYKH